MSTIRNIETKIDGGIIANGLLEITPPAITIKREPLIGLIDRSFDNGVEELQPEIKITGMPGRILEFMKRWGGTAPVIEVGIEYSDETCGDVQSAYIKLQVEIISAPVPPLAVGDIEPQALELGRCYLFEYQENGTEIYYLSSGYDNAPPVFRINGTDYLAAC